MLVRGGSQVPVDRGGEVGVVKAGGFVDIGRDVAREFDRRDGWARMTHGGCSTNERRRKGGENQTSEERWFHRAMLRTMPRSRARD